MSEHGKRRKLSQTVRGLTVPAKQTARRFMTVSGRIDFLPWVTLPKAANVFGFKFVPVRLDDCKKVFGAEIAEPAAKAIGTHVTQSSTPIDSCTVILRPRAALPWHVTEQHWRRAWQAASVLSFCCLSEQEFMRGHFSAHLNASMFRPVSMAVSEGSQHIGLYYPRRGGGLQVGGRTFSDVVFQQPPQIEGTRCDVVNVRLAEALRKAQRGGHEVWDRVEQSLDYFHLANTETQDLSEADCLALSAVAFERLLAPKQSSALGLADALADLWKAFPNKALAKAKRIKPDNDSKFGAQQQAWPLHRKWMKELYEGRSSHVHRGPKGAFSQNWLPWQHAVIAAFVFPLAVKLQLSTAGFYAMSQDEQVACQVLDDLLDSHWGNGWRKPPEWPGILSEARAMRSYRPDVQKIIDKLSAS